MAKHFLYSIFLFLWMGTLSSQTDSSKVISLPTTSALIIDSTTSSIPKIDTAKTTLTTQPTPTISPAITTTATTKPVPSGTFQLVDPNGRRHFFRNPSTEKLNKQLALLYKDTAYDRKAEIVIKNKRYRIFNNYITIGGGYAYSTGWRSGQLNSSVDYQFHAKKYQFQIGGFLMGPQFLVLSTTAQAHIAFGYKKERCNYFWAVYGGISYTGGYKKSDTSAVYNQHISNIGGYINAKVFYKVNFDYGIGASAFLDVNASQTVFGIRAELFFSGAYKGFKKINWAKEDEKYTR